MSDRSPWRAIRAWDGIAKSGLLGAGLASNTGLAITPRNNLAIAQVISSESDLSGLQQALARHYKIELSLKPKAASQGDLTVVWSGPCQWLAVSSVAGLSSQLIERLRGVAAVTDQSDGRAVLVLEGDRVRDVLAKGCPVDLHPRSFSPGDAAVTAIGGIGVHIWRPSDGDAFHLAVPRSMAGSFWSWLTHSAAEFGIDVRHPR